MRTRWLEDSEASQNPHAFEAASEVPRLGEDGIQIERLWAGDQLVVRTLDCAFDVMVVSPRAREVVIRGGTRFPSVTAARLEGCSSDGTFVKTGTIAVGCAIELSTAAGPVVTAPVTAISFVRRG